MIRPKIGDVYYAELDGIESEQKGRRPVVIIQNNIGNKHSGNVVVATMTSKLKKTTLPTHVLINNNNKLKDTIVQCESLKTISKSRLEDYVTTLSDEDIGKIGIASLISTPTLAYSDTKTIIDLIKQIRIKNNILNPIAVA